VTLEYFWFFVMPIVGMVMLVVYPLTLILLWFRYLHPAARKLNRLIRRKATLFFDVYDTGRIYLRGLFERRGAAIGRTVDGLYRFLPKLKSLEKEGNDLTKKLLVEAAGKRFIFEDTGLPTFFGYGGMLCLTTPEVLALVEQTKDPVFVDMEKGEVIRLKKSAKLLIDPRRLGELVERFYDESQLKAVINDIWAILQEQRGLSRFVIPLAVIAAIAFALIIMVQIIGGLRLG